MKDTKYEDLNKTLAAVGKAVFVNFYYDFKDFSISKDELAKKILSENPGSKSDSQNFRIPRARHIFESGQEKEALRIIIESKRVDKKAIEKAKNILVKEIIREDFQTESVEERQFIEHFNQEIQYDTTLKEAPLIAERTQYIYPRKQSEASVAKNYLSEQEMRSLERIVSAYLDLAEDRAERHIPMTMEDWAKRLDLFLMADDREVLQDAGKITAEIAKAKAETEFEKYRVIQDRLFMSDFDKYMLELEENAKK